MPASRRHLDLSQLLSSGSKHARPHPLPEQQLSDLFDSIALNRVRINKTAWQGHRVDALLWHLPDLKPAGKEALGEYVVNCWHALRQDETGHPQPNTAQDKTSNRLPTVDQIMKEQETKTDAGGKTFAAPWPDRTLMNQPARHRDWFDGLTDWVAAVVSLFK